MKQKIKIYVYDDNLNLVKEFGSKNEVCNVLGTSMSVINANLDVRDFDYDNKTIKLRRANLKGGKYIFRTSKLCLRGQ